ncbi:SIMPL domain-containing protein [Microbacterium sp. KR10-403]|uniref:SIMPL domain-containing protein n=1 Tax=Microbacterium sp. KR10-403 TaxID=3158581 RepID=UPI0032E50EEA
MPEVTITVRGEHELRRAPEQAVAHIAVRAEGPDRGLVVERIAALAAPIREELAERKAAGTLVDWSSQRVAVWSDRPWAGEKRLAVVHHAGVDITATFDDFAALSWWITQVAERDGVEVRYIDWRLTDDTAAALEREAAAHAVQVAVARATAYAVALGLSEVIPAEVADRGLLSPGAPTARALMAATGAMDAAAVDFRPDDITVSAAVEARFTAR